jgi:dihydropteroate synthase
MILARSVPAAPIVMGVLNVTADSFSDGGRYLDVDAAVEHGLAMHRLGVDIVDVGGESTRPGADRVDPSVEAQRVVPVISALAAGGVSTSVDTMRAHVAAAAIEAGVSIVNDVSGGRADPAMADVVAQGGLPWILMHWRAADSTFRHTGPADHYDDVVADVRRELLEQVDHAVSAGVDASRIVLDPGLGFAKNAEHNWQLLRGLPTLVESGFPVLVGASRKRFLGSLLAEPDGSCATTLPCLHDVRSSLDAVAVVRAWQGGRA